MKHALLHPTVPWKRRWQCDIVVNLSELPQYLRNRLQRHLGRSCYPSIELSLDGISEGATNEINPWECNDDRIVDWIRVGNKRLPDRLITELDKWLRANPETDTQIMQAELGEPE